MSDPDHDVHPYIPVLAREIPIERGNRSRRSSLLDVGGTSSINNFASSLQRSVDYLSKSLESGAETLENGSLPPSPLISAATANSNAITNVAAEDLNTVIIDEELWNRTARPSYGTIDERE